jgi:hypothetical protein
LKFQESKLVKIAKAQSFESNQPNSPSNQRLSSLLQVSANHPSADTERKADVAVMGERL